MKYNALKRQPAKSFKITDFDGGMDLVSPPTSINKNAVSQSLNMWYKNSRLQTRPGFKGEIDTVNQTEILGNFAELNYKITDTVVYMYGEYYRLATADALSGNAVHTTNVFLVDLYGNIMPMGVLEFRRVSSNNFYVPVNMIFFNGKSVSGGGVFAFVTLQNMHNFSEYLYEVYEVDGNYTEWQRVDEFYIPTVFINGRGNKYQTAKSEIGFEAPSPMILESQNILNGKFHAYYTSDGYSNSFKLPFNALAEDEVICRIYYTLTDYAEWVIPADSMQDTVKFWGKDVSALIDRDKGMIYFIVENGDFAIPSMNMYPENNIKVTATKEIKNGLCNIVHSSCFVRNNSKLLLSGGADGNTVYTADFENPLYFPKNSCVTIGESSGKITALAVQQGKTVVFKEHEIYTLTVKEGSAINEISLLSDNDKTFRKGNTFTVETVSKSIGCYNPRTIARCGRRNLWLSCDNAIYALDLSGGNEIENISKKVAPIMPDFYSYYYFAVADDTHYYFVFDDKVLVCEATKSGESKPFLWKLPQEMKLQSAFYHDGKLQFLVSSERGQIAYMTSLSGETDSVFYYEDQNLQHSEKQIESLFTTKSYDFSQKSSMKNIESIYLAMSGKKNVKVSVNDNAPTNINFDSSNEVYDKCDYKLVKLMPHLHSVDTLCLTFATNSRMSIGEIEIIYRLIG